MSLFYQILPFLFFSPLIIKTNFTEATTNNRGGNQSHFFFLMKNSLTPSSFFTSFNETNYCNQRRVSCNSRGEVTSLAFNDCSLSGHFPDNVCYFIPTLCSLLLDGNHMVGAFPSGITNCTFLESLNLSGNPLTGPIPDLSPLKYLKSIDLSYTLFTGEFSPLSISNLTNLMELVFNEVSGLTPWNLPLHGFPLLRNLKTMILTSCMLTGTIPAAIGNSTSLENIQLSGNFLHGGIPREMGKLKNLRLMEMYYQRLSGSIPEELGNLSLLKDLDLSVNKLTGEIPFSICGLPGLGVLQLYNNSLSGELPYTLGNSTSLSILSLYANSLTGGIPSSMGLFSSFIGVDLSENSLSGNLPEEICSGGKLLYFLALDNSLSGKIPEKYGKCYSLLRFRVSNNLLHGAIPRGIMGLPHVFIIDMSFNLLNGSLVVEGRAGSNMSELFLQGNRISGFLPVKIFRARNLVKLDLSNNHLSGPLPQQLGDLNKLSLLLLHGNKLNSPIPESLYSLTSLNYLDLSQNLFTGVIKESICNLLLPNSLNFSNNLLSGPLPLCISKAGFIESFKGNPGLCTQVHLDSSYTLPPCPLPPSSKMVLFWTVVFSSSLFLLFVILIMLRCWLREKKAVALLPPWLYSYEVKSFHRLKVEVRCLISSMVEKNVLGNGRFGTVYKIELGNGEVVAVKKQWRGNRNDMELENELKTEVGILASVRHKNIVKLLCYFSGLDCNMLVFEYMENGSLWDAIHERGIILDWPCRHKIAVGIAHGLAHLHHGSIPPIVHRDVKSRNILLDANYRPKVADFGLAKVFCGGEEDSSAKIAGTYGYLAPEVVYSPTATTKCDVYSFGIVLMELITGRKPVDEYYGENKNIACWVTSKLEAKGGGVMEVLDKRISSTSIFLDEMIQMLRIALRCTYMSPLLRPSMNEVVQFLNDIDPLGRKNILI